MDAVKLALLINNTFDAIERSKIGSIYLKDADGNILKSAEGCPFCNMAAMGAFQSALQAQIMKEKHEI